MLLFAFDRFSHLAKFLESSAVQRGEFHILRHTNQEAYVRVQTPVRNETCGILATIDPPDENLFSLLLLADTLKKEGASNVYAIIPYFAYARHDKNKPGESLATRAIGKLLAAAGIDEIVTLDLHCSAEHFPLKITSLPPADLFAPYITERETTFVAPDERAVRRCEALQSAAGLSGPVVFFKKKRTGQGVVQEGPIGEVGRYVLLVDDMLDTGGTLIEACQKLKDTGATDIVVMVTHGLFTGTAWENLWDLGVSRIYCTDSIPPSKPSDSRITRIASAPLLQNFFEEATARQAITLTLQ